MTEHFAVGTYTTIQPHVPGACGKGVSVITLNNESGELTLVSTYTEIDDPTYLCWYAEGRKLYAVTEDPNTNGRISSFTISSSLNLSREIVVEGPGKAGCHLTVLPDINRIFAASYLDGSIAGYMLDDNEPGTPVFKAAYSGSGPNAARQEGPHAHQILRSPDRRRLYTCDLGSDTIWMHSLDSEGNAGSASQALKVPAGYGPRHLAFDPGVPFAYILCELMPKLITVRINPADGIMEVVSEQDTVKSPRGNPSNPAAIKIHPSGKTLAVTNRFQDTIALFEINTTGSFPNPVLAEEFDCRGKTPRDITFTRDGGWLLIANQDSDNIECRRFNSRTGLPEAYWARGLKTGSPVCITGLEGLV